MGNIIKRLAVVFALVLLVQLLPVQVALAQGGILTNPVPSSNTGLQQYNNPQDPDGKACTSFAENAQKAFNNPSPGNDGLLSDIYRFIVDTVNDASEKLFSAFTGSASYEKALYGAVTLMVIFYAVGFTIGIVQPNFQQVLIRLVKMGILFTLISPAGWQFFQENVVQFFQDGSDDIIKGVQQIGTGISAPQGATPFYALDRIAQFVIQPDTIVALLGSTLAGGPFGLTMGALMMIAVMGFFMLVIKVLKVYAITFVARAMLLGLAPIFFVFLLFDKTKTMFTGWLNAMINLSLQPILLFTFLSFFIVMIESASRDMLGAELCWQEFKNVEGSVNKMAFWRYVDPNTKETVKGDMSWKGSMDCLLSPNNTGQGGNSCPEFPVNIVDILSFLILIYIAQRFTDVVERISSELSNAFVALDTQGKLEQMMQGSGHGGGGAAGFNTHAGGHSGKRK